MKHVYILFYSSNLRRGKYLQFFIVEVTDPFILHNK